MKNLKKITIFLAMALSFFGNLVNAMEQQIEEDVPEQVGQEQQIGMSKDEKIFELFSWLVISDIC